jgi:cytoskeletal protein CcmA (bactofilin family)
MKAGRRDSGYALVAVMILITALLLVATAFVAMSGQETGLSQGELDSQRAFWLAEAGKERAILWLQSQERPPQENQVIFQNTRGPDGGRYTVRVVVDTSAAYQVQKMFELESVGQSGNRQRRIVQEVRMISFARFAYFTDQEDYNGRRIWFSSGDLLEGPVHTNGTFHIHGSPTFQGPVTSSSDHMIGYSDYQVFGPGGWPVGGNDPRFAQSFELGVPAIPLPSNTMDLKQMALDGGLHFGPETEVELGRNGTGGLQPGLLRYRASGNPTGPWTVIAVSSLSSGVIYGDNDVHVSGVLDGELTIASAKMIRVEDDITYAASVNAVPLPGCNDLFGLVAGRDIIFADNPNTVDLKVDGVLMALRTITAEGYNVEGKGTLTIWGGLIQDHRGSVGQTNIGGQIRGYVKDYHYDQRVTARTPPGFPLTGIFERSIWNETWNENGAS